MCWDARGDGAMRAGAGALRGLAANARNAAGIGETKGALAALARVCRGAPSRPLCLDAQLNRKRRRYCSYTSTTAGR